MAEQLLASRGDDRTVRIWDPRPASSGPSWKATRAGSAAVCSVTVAGRELLASAGSDGTVRIWDPETGRSALSLEGHPGWLRRAVCPVTVAGRQLLASAGSDGTVRSGTPKPASSSRPGRQPGRGRVVCGHHGRAGTCSPAAATTAPCGYGTPKPASSGPRWRVIAAACWSVCPVTVAGRQLLASAGSGGTVRIWDPGTGEQRVTLVGHQGGVRSVCPVTVAGENLLASAGNDGTVRIWDPGTGQQRTVLEGHRSVLWSVCPIDRRRPELAGQRQQRRHRAGLGPRDRAAAHGAGRSPVRDRRRVPDDGGREGACWPAPATTARCGSGTPRPGRASLTIPTHYPPQATAWVAGSLAIGLGAGILVIKPRAAG